MPARSRLRSTVARVARPMLVALDVRLEQLAARLELHTSNLGDRQRREIALLDDRLALDVAVMSEHLVAMERMARSVTVSMPNPMTTGTCMAVALPGEPLVLADGAHLVAALAQADDGTWRVVADSGSATLRIATLPDAPV